MRGRRSAMSGGHLQHNLMLRECRLDAKSEHLAATDSYRSSSMKWHCEAAVRRHADTSSAASRLHNCTSSCKQHCLLPSMWVNLDLASSARFCCSRGRRKTLGELSMAAMEMTSLEQLQAAQKGPIRCPLSHYGHVMCLHALKHSWPGFVCCPKLADRLCCDLSGPAVVGLSVHLS